MRVSTWDDLASLLRAYFCNEFYADRMRMVEPLLESFRRETVEPRAGECAVALKVLTRWQNVNVLVELAGHKTLSQGSVALLLGKMDDRQAIAPLIMALDNENWTVQLAAVRLLVPLFVKYGEWQILPALMAFLEGKRAPTEVRLAVMNALPALKQRADARGRAFIESAFKRYGVNLRRIIPDEVVMPGYVVIGSERPGVLRPFMERDGSYAVIRALPVGRLDDAAWKPHYTAYFVSYFNEDANAFAASIATTAVPQKGNMSQ